MARIKAPKVEDPNKLKRERAGRYVTPDGRFAVEGNSTGSWYLVDSERENELGLPLMAGPFATLDEARDRLTAARDDAETKPAKPDDAVSRDANDRPQQAPNRPALRSMPGGRRDVPERTEMPEPRAEAEPADPEPKLPPEPAAAVDRVASRPASKPGPKTGAPGATSEPPSEPTWLERLPRDGQADAHRLLALLKRLGIDDPALVRRDVEANQPDVMRSLMARRVRREAVDPWRDPKKARREIEALPKSVRRALRSQVEDAAAAAERVLAGNGSPDDGAAFAWLVALRTAGAVFEAIDAEGDERRITGEPGWRLLELDGRREPTKRTISLEQSDLLDVPQD